MKKIWAIATIAVRSAVRSRVLLSLAFLLLAAVIGLPLTIRGDGTLAGHLQILLRYSLGAAFVLLGVAMVWSGCASISTEIRDRQMHLVASKPVHPLTLWLGKWLGLLMVQAVLMAVAGGGVYAFFRWTTRPAALDSWADVGPAASLLSAYDHVGPIAPEVENEARERVRRSFEEGELPSGMTSEDALAGVRWTLTQRAFSVSPGGRTEWVFRLPVERPPEQPMQLQFRFEKSVLDMEPVRGRWTFGGAAGGAHAAVDGAYRPQSIHRIEVPRSAWDGSGRLVVRFENTEPVPTMLVFDPSDGLALRVYRGDFTANYVRTLLVLFFRLSFLSALGLATGTLLSLPVAAFASVSFMLFVWLHDYIEGMASAGSVFASSPDSGFALIGLDRFFALVFRLLAYAVRPLRGGDPLDWLAAGRWVSNAFLWRELLIQVVVYGGLLAVLCAGLFRRRELGIPT